MEEKEKLVKLSEKAWHYKLLKWTWGIDPKIFKNLCPYFWLCIAGVLFIPITLVKKLFVHIKSMLEIRNKQKQEQREENLRSEGEKLDLSEEEVYQIFKFYCSALGSHTYTSPKVSDLINRYGRNIYDYLLRGGKFKSFSDKTIEVYEEKRNKHLRDLRVIETKERAKKEQQKERLKKISANTKAAASFLMCLCIVGLISLVANILCVIIIIISQNLIDFSIGLAQLLLILLSVSVCTLGFISANDKYLIHKGEECYGLENRYLKTLGNIFYVPYYPLRLFWDKIIVSSFNITVSVFVGVIEGIKEFGGLFSSYLSSSYSDYCPGIEWEENNDKN